MAHFVASTTKPVPYDNTPRENPPVNLDHVAYITKCTHEHTPRETYPAIEFRGIVLPNGETFVWLYSDVESRDAEYEYVVQEAQMSGTTFIKEKE